MPKRIEDEKVYLAAVQTVIERGYSGATTKQIAEAAHISEVTLFRKYGNKAQLVKLAIADMAEKIDLGSATHYSGNVAADLLRVVQMYQGTAEKSGRFFYTMLLEIPRHPELTDILDLPIGMISEVGQLVVRYQEEGILTQENPLFAVSALLGPLMAANLIREASTDIPLPPLDLPTHVAHFLDGRST